MWQLNPWIETHAPRYHARLLLIYLYGVSSHRSHSSGPESWDRWGSGRRLSNVINNLKFYRISYTPPRQKYFPKQCLHYGVLNCCDSPVVCYTLGPVPAPGSRWVPKSRKCECITLFDHRIVKSASVSHFSIIA